MSWVKLDDQFPDHPKVVEAGPLAAWLYVCGVTYCNRFLTDGFIPAGQVRRLADVDNAGELAAALVRVGLWECVEGGYKIHDLGLHRFQPDSEGRDLWDALRDTIAPRIYERDGYKCSYCGAVDDLTIDHVDPIFRGGGHDPDNLTVACRSCNSSKGAKTLEEWER